ncbi:hypothetical protein [Salipaludibacillus daqingensis]|uniref:hypothetical protein n=1 Tax=Salipaludibacillus daqingensis TaxID=3041001 RepID=UPI002473F2B9|nr:hypothetical protein [Salipaludibacillus daqingensis]
MKWILSVLVFMVISLIMKNRYRVLNALLRKRWLRTLAISFVMNIPSVREKMMYQTFR